MLETSPLPKDGLNKKKPRVAFHLSAGPQDFNTNAPWIPDASVRICQLRESNIVLQLHVNTTMLV